MTTRLNLLKRWSLLVIALVVALGQASCGYVAAGAVGAAVGHEVAEHEDEDDEN